MTYLKLLLMIAVSVPVAHCGPSSSSGDVDVASLSENLQKAECLKGVYKGNADVDDNLLKAGLLIDDSIVTISVNHNGQSGAEEQVIFYVESEDDEGEAFCSVYGGLGYRAGIGDEASTLSFSAGESRGVTNNRGAIQPSVGFKEASSNCSLQDIFVTDDVNTSVNVNSDPQRVRGIEKQGDKVPSFAELQQKCADLSGTEEAWYSWKFWR